MGNLCIKGDQLNMSSRAAKDIIINTVYRVLQNCKHMPQLGDIDFITQFS